MADRGGRRGGGRGGRGGGDGGRDGGGRGGRDGGGRGGRDGGGRGGRDGGGRGGRDGGGRDGGRGGRDGGGDGGRGGGRGRGPDKAPPHPFAVLSNVYEVTLGSSLVYEYGLEFAAESEGFPERRLRRRAFRGAVIWHLLHDKLGATLDESRILFDGTTIMSLDSLDDIASSLHRVELPARTAGRSADVINVTVAPAKEVRMSAVTGDLKESLINRILHHALRYTPFVKHIGLTTKYLTEIVDAPRIAREAMIARGFSVSIIMAKNGPVLVHEVAHSVVMTIQCDKLPSDLLMNKRVGPIYTEKQTYSVIGVQDKSLDTKMCADKTETFRDYYVRKFDTISHPRLEDAYRLCAKVIKDTPKGRPIRMLKVLNDDDQEIWLIAGLCRLLDLPKNVREFLPRVCGIQPWDKGPYVASLEDHFSKRDPAAHAVGARLTELGWPKADLPSDFARHTTAVSVLDEWGMRVNTTPIPAKAMSLPPAKVSMGDGAGAPEAPGLKVRAANRDGLKCTPMDLAARGGTKKKVLLIMLDTDRSKEFAKHVWRDMDASFRRHGVTCPNVAGMEPFYVQRDVKATCRTLVERITKGDVAFAFIITEGLSDDTYNPVKYALNSNRIMCPSQAMKVDTFERMRGQWPVLTDALVRQVRSKLDSIPYLPAFGASGLRLPERLAAAKASILILGFDVTHKPALTSGGLRGMKPSLAAISAFWIRDNRVLTFDQLDCHAARTEISEFTGGLFSGFLKFILDSERGHEPTHVIVLRDGIGGSSETEVARQELSQVVEAIKARHMKNPPVVAFLLALKRIKQTLLAAPNTGYASWKSDKFSSARSCPTGTVIADPRIVEDEKKEFFLNAQDPLGCPSTVRFVHYRSICLGVRPGMSETPAGEQAKLLEDLKQLIFVLCFCYPNWPGPVLLPAPLHYTHCAARRADEVFTGLKLPHDKWKCPPSRGLRWL